MKLITVHEIGAEGKDSEIICNAENINAFYRDGDKTVIFFYGMQIEVTETTDEIKQLIKQ